ncbi:MAG: hypothetical protein ACT4PV_11725 [Planctomycetaceae bacterium]
MGDHGRGFLADLESRPVTLQGADELRPLGLLLGQGRWQLEVVALAADARPTAARLRALWKQRSAGRPNPLLVVALEGDAAYVCGPVGDDPDPDRAYGLMGEGSVPLAYPSLRERLRGRATARSLPGFSCPNEWRQRIGIEPTYRA